MQHKTPDVLAAPAAATATTATTTTAIADAALQGLPPLPSSHRGADGCCRTPAHGAPPPSASGSRRRRVWELGTHAHCPVIGVCLPMAELRRLAAKATGGQTIAGDHELHCGTVADCQHRSHLTEAVQRELDRRYLLPLRRAASAKTAEQLAAWWQAQANTKDLPGALWATLTHPRCTPAIEHQVLGQVHMLQHQVGMATRVELERFEALIDENAVLTRALAGAQRRSTQQAAAHGCQAEQLQAEAIRLRGQLLARDSCVALLQDQIDTLNQAAPDLPGRLALSRENARLAERTTELQRALQAARAELERLRGQQRQHDGDRLPARRTDAAPAANDTAQPLDNRAVLCVGGRTASVPVYRRLVEDRGGRFLHHDGGDENNVNQLDATLAAADLVICQAGCVSHNAYWRVKDHCKRTGKRCVFVDNPSASGLQRALAEM